MTTHCLTDDERWSSCATGTPNTLDCRLLLQTPPEFRDLLLAIARSANKASNTEGQRHESAGPQS